MRKFVIGILFLCGLPLLCPGQCLEDVIRLAQDSTLTAFQSRYAYDFDLVDTEHLKVCFDVLENELHKFQAGTRLQVVSIAYPAEVHEAVVSAISPVVEKNGMVHLEATLPPHPHLMPGMTAIVTCI